MAARPASAVARIARAWAAGAALLAAAGFDAAAQTPPATRIAFDLPRAATTSAGVYGADGVLVRTLWRGESSPAGPNVTSWDGLDDLGRPAPAGDYDVRLLHHRLRYVWEGVVGNSAATVGDEVHKSLHPPTSIAIEGDTAYYAVGYNEQDRHVHSFALSLPQRRMAALPVHDPFAGLTMVATDGRQLYWANTGGLSRTTFVGAHDLRAARPFEFQAGQPLCLRKRENSDRCYEEQDYRSVLDLETAEGLGATGIAVQRNGRVLAVAHGALGKVRLFDKTTGQRLNDLAVPLNAKAQNQIAFSPRGDLWVISGRRLLRFTGVDKQPVQAAAIEGLAAPIAVAAEPSTEDVWVADGGSSQQLKRFGPDGVPGPTIGRPGGYTDPVASSDRLCFRYLERGESTAIAVAADRSVWVIDSCNNRMLHFTVAPVPLPVADAQIAWLPVVYASTVDHAQPQRVFANFLEFAATVNTPWQPGLSWKLVRNWLGGLPAELNDKRAFNEAWGGFQSVETLSNGRTYGLLAVNGRQAIVELPLAGPLRVVKWFATPMPRTTPKVLYENGDLGYALTGDKTQTVLRLPLLRFDGQGDPVWATEPQTLASVPTLAGTPWYRNAFSGIMGPRFPLTATGKVVFFDQSVTINEGFHLGAAQRGGSSWLWQASPTGPLDGKGSFQTKALDGALEYGGNAVWTSGRHIVYGYHGEFYRDLQTRFVGQANQFMHFDESGLFLGQFGQSTTRPLPPPNIGLAGNSFSPTLVSTGTALYLYHNDEQKQGGVHRWRLDGANDIQELRGRGSSGGSIVLR